ncbi:hypothetical protein FOA52_007725 [Chlamydomonas sp. UWO 241]|nr:hypothetical protein FOA52_007725 [Chlamydomonas sp. UWO 241]
MEQECAPLLVGLDAACVLVQHRHQNDGDACVPTLRIDLRTGDSRVEAQQALPVDSSLFAEGLLGVLRLRGGAVVALAMRASKVATLPSGAVLRLEDSKLIYHNNVNKLLRDLRVVDLLREALDPKRYGSHLYFAHGGADITRCMQAAHTAAAAANNMVSSSAQAHAWRTAGKDGGGGSSACGGGGGCGVHGRFEPRCIANMGLLEPLLCDDAVAAFATPLVRGFFGTTVLWQQRAPAPASGITVTLAARLESGRPGTLSWRRGLDAHGDNAHGLTVEQILVLPSRAEVEAAADGLWSRLSDALAESATGTPSLAGPDGPKPAHVRVGIHCTRAFRACFVDARKQDAIDLMARGARCGGDSSTGSGNGRVGGGDSSGGASDAVCNGMSMRSNSYAVLELGLALTLWGLVQACMVMYTRTYSPGGAWDVGSPHLGVCAGLPLGTGLAMLAYAVVCGGSYLEKPQLWSG